MQQLTYCHNTFSVYICDMTLKLEDPEMNASLVFISF